MPLMQVTDVVPNIGWRHERILAVRIGASGGRNCPLNLATGVYTFTHMIAFLGAAPLAHSFRMKTITPRFGIEEQRIVLAGVVAEGATARLIVPDDLILKPRAIGIWAVSEHFIKQDLCIMYDTPIQVNVDAALHGKQPVKQRQYFV